MEERKNERNKNGENIKQKTAQHLTFVCSIPNNTQSYLARESTSQTRNMRWFFWTILLLLCVLP